MIPVTDEVPGASEENLVATSESESQPDPSAPKQKNEVSQATGDTEALTAAEGPSEVVSNDSSSDSTQKHDDVHASALTSSDSLSSPESSSS